MDIDVKALTTYLLSEDGKSVVLRLLDAAGSERSVSFPLGELGNLAMTLPGLIEAALRRQFLDASLRYAYPMGSWAVEQAIDPGSVIVTLQTQDGFGVSFSMTRRQAEDLGGAIAVGPGVPCSLLAH